MPTSGPGSRKIAEGLVAQVRVHRAEAPPEEPGSRRSVLRDGNKRRYADQRRPALDPKNLPIERLTCSRGLLWLPKGSNCQSCATGMGPDKEPVRTHTRIVCDACDVLLCGHCWNTYHCIRVYADS